ncbi:unnamed protein product [Sympodiomycopsis kandeliae]
MVSQSRHENESVKQHSASKGGQHSSSPQGLSAKLRRLSSLPSLKSKKSNSSLGSSSSASRKGTPQHKPSSSINGLERHGQVPESEPPVPPVPAPVAHRAPPHHVESLGSALRLYQPSDFSRSRGGEFGSSRTNKGYGVRTCSNESYNNSNTSSADSHSSDRTMESSTSSVPTTMSSDSRFSDRRLSAWDVHLRAMLAPNEAAARAHFTPEEHVLLDKMQKHFSARSNLHDWDASLSSSTEGTHHEVPPRFSMRSSDGWDSQIPLDVLAQEVIRRRFSTRMDEDWDASLKSGSSERKTHASNADTNESDTISDEHIKAHFSSRPPEDWDGRILAAYSLRLSARPLTEWDAKIFQKMLASRFSTRPEKDWDASLSSSSDRYGGVRRSRSSTVFSDRRLSAWDSGLVQKIPDVSQTGGYASEEDGSTDSSDVRRIRSTTIFSNRTWQDWDSSFVENPSGTFRLDNTTPTPQEHSNSNGKRNRKSVFSVRDFDSWDAGLTSQLKEALARSQTAKPV